MLPAQPKTLRTLPLAKSFYRECERLTAPRHVQDQLRRAALSIVNNLAEGSAKPTSKDRAKFYAQALGSFRECQAMLDLLDQQAILREHDLLGICLFRLHRATAAQQSHGSPPG